MNTRQRSYDSYNKMTLLLKLTNSYYHNKNLDLIKNRKSQYGNRKKEKLMHKSKYIEPCKDFYVIKNNEAMTNRINDMRWKHSKPKINNIFLNKESKLLHFRQLYNNIFDTIRIKENEKYLKRINDQKPFISTKALNKEFKENHLRTLKKLRNVSENDMIILPKIRNRYKTQESKKNKKNDDESENDDKNASKSDFDSKDGE